ncbi:hypothetical protein [Fredinandcohnia quinoae]|uniref:Uncharacterized protein n=1 Tax=Fredinandcohnia quinoae TaxID=2918902 RepID=A0AAW5DX30_9BACI|nr:hypothetical protein [Fredinandcohnia sp. SECRCQ15]MCH1625201.1 hypothetical protein [Fredinandcohnia sp. SECRCQ15]
MKKYVTALCSSFLVILMLVAPGNTALAHEGSGDGDDCGCGVTYVKGAEKNKIVANILKSKEFKEQKKILKSEGYNWLGANKIVVVKKPVYDETGKLLVSYTIAAVPFENKDGSILVAGFTDGIFMGVQPGPIPF